MSDQTRSRDAFASKNGSISCIYILSPSVPDLKILSAGVCLFVPAPPAEVGGGGGGGEGEGGGGGAGGQVGEA